MKHMKTVKVPATTTQVVESVTCDLCGAVIKRKPYDAEAVDVRHRTGSNYQEGNRGEEVRVDMCGACFDGKLVPWLRAQGADPKPEEWEW